jgi:hypothetical protein
MGRPRASRLLPGLGGLDDGRAALRHRYLVSSVGRTLDRGPRRDPDHRSVYPGPRGLSLHRHALVVPAPRLRIVGDRRSAAAGAAEDAALRRDRLRAALGPHLGAAGARPRLAGVDRRARLRSARAGFRRSIAFAPRAGDLLAVGRSARRSLALRGRPAPVGRCRDRRPGAHDQRPGTVRDRLASLRSDGAASDSSAHSDRRSSRAARGFGGERSRQSLRPAGIHLSFRPVDADRPVVCGLPADRRNAQLPCIWPGWPSGI